MNEVARDIRGLMINVSNGRVLLPNACVAEIAAAASIERIERVPAWILGRVTWRGWHVPLFSFSILADLTDKEAMQNAKIAILKSLTNSQKVPFIAMLCSGFPRLTTVTPESLVPTSDGLKVMSGMGARVMVKDDLAYIPDLPTIEEMLVTTLASSQ